MNAWAEDLIAEEGPLLVVTGAGVSVASGLPVFRGVEPNAVWNRDVTELGTLRYFQEDPAGSWRFYLERFDALLGTTPNAAHRAIAALETWKLERGQSFLLVTQNIDRLHDAAGSQNLIEVHGRADRMRCELQGCEHGAPRGSLPRGDDEFDAFRKEHKESQLPRCPSCRELLRPHVLWFDERYDGHRDYRIDEALRAAKRARSVLFVGTSFSVGATEAILQTGLQRNAQLYLIDPSGRSPHPRIRVAAQPAEVALPALVNELTNA
ncbi:MAG: Sir2 family NAD-dependent protein deacetylase [Myxococcota bacterium]